MHARITDEDWRSFIDQSENYQRRRMRGEIDLHDLLDGTMSMVALKSRPERCIGFAMSGLRADANFAQMSDARAP